MSSNDNNQPRDSLKFTDPNEALGSDATEEQKTSHVVSNLTSALKQLNQADKSFLNDDDMGFDIKDCEFVTEAEVYSRKTPTASITETRSESPSIPSDDDSDVEPDEESNNSVSHISSLFVNQGKKKDSTSNKKQERDDDPEFLRSKAIWITFQNNMGKFLKKWTNAHYFSSLDVNASLMLDELMQDWAFPLHDKLNLTMLTLAPLSIEMTKTFYKMMIAKNSPQFLENIDIYASGFVAGTQVKSLSKITEVTEEMEQSQALIVREAEQMKDCKDTLETVVEKMREQMNAMLEQTNKITAINQALELKIAKEHVATAFNAPPGKVNQQYKQSTKIIVCSPHSIVLNQDDKIDFEKTVKTNKNLTMTEKSLIEFLATFGPKSTKRALGFPWEVLKDFHASIPEGDLRYKKDAFGEKLDSTNKYPPAEIIITTYLA